MGFLDFLNPKKAIEKKISSEVEKSLGSSLGEIKSMTDASARRAKLEQVVGAEMRSQANDHIPGALQKHSNKIIANATTDLVNKIDSEIS